MVLETFAEVFPVLVLWAFAWMLPAFLLAWIVVRLQKSGVLKPLGDLLLAARRMSPAEGWLIPSTPVTLDEIAAGFRAPADGAAGIVPAPGGAVTNARGRLRGAHDDALRLDPAGLRIPVLDGVVTGVTVLTCGEVRPDVGTLYFPVSPVDGVSLLPESRWGLLSRAPEAGAQPNCGGSPAGASQDGGPSLGYAPAPGAQPHCVVFLAGEEDAPAPGAQPHCVVFLAGEEDAQDGGPSLGCAPAPGARERASVFWHARSPLNSLLLTWENALVGRDPDCPTNLQAELYADGRFAWRTDDASRLYLPVLDFDWDGDGLENSVDPDPLVAGPCRLHPRSCTPVGEMAAAVRTP